MQHGHDTSPRSKRTQRRQETETSTQNVRAWMTHPVLTIEPEASALEAIERMGDGGFRHLPVVTTKGELVGILSIDDLRAALPFEVSLRIGLTPRDRVTAREYTVGELMTFSPFVVDPEASLASAALQLTQRQIGCLPVVDKGGRLVGILTESDALRALAALLEKPKRLPARVEGLQKLARELRREHDRILVQLGRRQNEERAASAEASEPGDEADSSAQETVIALTGALADLASRRLGEIDRALTREAQGQLGVCVHCGGRIPLGRLRAMPGTSACIECAQKLEHTRH